ncbi:MAG: Hsp20/alpha crystallin family protein [Clostridium sp.]
MFGIIPFKTNNSSAKDGYRGNLFDDFFSNDFLAPIGMDSEMSKFKVDVKETDKKYIVSADLPGVDKKDISVNYKNKYIVITAKREEEHEEKDEKDEKGEKKEHSYLRKEKTYGEFSRSFYFDNIQPDKINAKFENGVLKVELPKQVKEEDKATKVEIK